MYSYHPSRAVHFMARGETAKSVPSPRCLGRHTLGVSSETPAVFMDAVLAQWRHLHCRGSCKMGERMRCGRGVTGSRAGEWLLHNP